MTLRPATLADAALLTELATTTMREAFGPPHNPADLVEAYLASSITESILQAELSDPRAYFVLLETDDHTPVGYAKMRRATPPRRMPQPYRSRAVEIQRIYLLQSRVGQGWGQLLMNYCLDWARQRGHAAVWLGVWERNQRALAFYEKGGFTRFGFHYFQFGPERQRDFWLMKPL